MLEKYILKDGKPVECKDLMEWATWMETSPIADRVVGRDTVNDVEVSTVFMGLNHNFSFYEKGEPILYETMVFGGPLSRTRQRYATAEEARAGHVAMLARVLSGA